MGDGERNVNIRNRAGRSASSAKVTDASTLPPTPVTSVGPLQHIGFLCGVFEGGSLPSTNEQGADGGARQTSEVQVLLDFICFGGTITFFVILKWGLMTFLKKIRFAILCAEKPKIDKINQDVK